MHDFQAQIRLFGRMMGKHVWSFRKAHLTMRRYFLVRRVKSDKKGAFKALKSITAHENASNKQKAPFLGKEYDFHKKCQIFHDFLKPKAPFQEKMLLHSLLREISSPKHIGWL